MNETVEAFYRKNYKSLVSMTTNRVPNKSHHLAEECVQEAFYNALKYWHTFNPEKGKLVTWFGRILTDRISKCIRAEGPVSVPLEEEDEELQPFKLEQEEGIPAWVVTKVTDAIKSEPGIKGEVLNMFFLLGMSCKDISDVVGISHTAIRKMVSRWKLKLEKDSHTS